MVPVVPQKPRLELLLFRPVSLHLDSTCRALRFPSAVDDAGDKLKASVRKRAF